MNVLVTGASGFTGGWLARYLVNQGDRVRALIRPASRGKSEDLLAHGIELVQGDLADRGSLVAACEDIKVVYHIAASYRTAGQLAKEYREVNVGGTKRLLEAAAEAGVARVVHCSTGGVHGDVKHPPANEEAPLAPGDVYQASKLEGEQLARAFGEQNGLDVVVVRPIGIYGPGDTRFLKMFRGLARRRFPMLGSGNVYYHLTYVEDLVRGFRLCATTSDAAGRTYLLAGPRYTTLTDLVGLIAEELKVSPPGRCWPVWPVWLAGALCEGVCIPLRVNPPLFRRRVEFYTKSRAFDASRAKAELGFEPRVDLREGIHRTAVWYQEQGWL